jgi:hypothetical protein
MSLALMEDKLKTLVTRIDNVMGSANKVKKAADNPTSVLSSL